MYPYVMRTFAVLAIAISALLAVFAAAQQIGGLPPCPTEDSASCFWDASRGNGLGHSFTSDENGVVTYTTP